MAKTRRRRRKGEESVSGYFRQIFDERPELLYSKSNAEILERWMADHQASEVPTSVRSNLANLKSLLRKKERERLDQGGEVATRARTQVLTAADNALEALEEHIDDSLTMARMLDRIGLEEVIDLLRRARNKVVWRLGE